MSAQPSEMVVGNMVRRVLKVIRDEEERTRGGSGPGAGSLPDTGERCNGCVSCLNCLVVSMKSRLSQCVGPSGAVVVVSLCACHTRVIVYAKFAVSSDQ